MSAAHIIASAYQAPEAHPLFPRLIARVKEAVGHISPMGYYSKAKESSEDGASFHHLTVLSEESIHALKAGTGKILVDCTLGGGGHSEALLEAGARVIGIDQDEDALVAAKSRLARFGDRFQALRGNFRKISQLLRNAGIQQVDGILADIGVSSHQIDTAERGFSFQQDGPLDMRMDRSEGRSAADWLNTASESELLRILWDYGEEKAARNIVRAILEHRQSQSFSRTSELVRICERSVRGSGPKNPATRTFQALRIAVNDELGALEELLQQSIALLAPGGRLAIITFHSLEDRIVKHFLRDHSQATLDRPEWPAPRPNPNYHYRLLQRKPVTASAAENQRNPRARSAKLRSAERLAQP